MLLSGLKRSVVTLASSGEMELMGLSKLALSLPGIDRHTVLYTALSVSRRMDMKIPSGSNRDENIHKSLRLDIDSAERSLSLINIPLKPCFCLP